MRSVRGPVSPKRDTLGDRGDDDASAPLLVLIEITLAPAEFKQGRSHPKGDSHDKHILMLTAVTVALVWGGIPATAQEDSDDPAMMRHWDEAQQNEGDEEDTGMMGPA